MCDLLDFVDLLTDWLLGGLSLADGNEDELKTPLADHPIVAPEQTTTTTKRGKRKDSYRP